jgi:hypothetical protein
MDQGCNRSASLPIDQFLRPSVCGSAFANDGVLVIRSPPHHPARLARRLGSARRATGAANQRTRCFVRVDPTNQPETSYSARASRARSVNGARRATPIRINGQPTAVALAAAKNSS